MQDGTREQPIVVLGATGFVGSATAESLLRAKKRVVATSRNKQSSRGRRVDVRDKESVVSAITGSAGTVHSASYVGNDSDLHESINVEGTRNIVEAWAQCGSGPLVYVSTAAVYGRGRFTNAGEDAVVSPDSPLSRSRATAEKIVLDAGGAVIRPNMVVGSGDIWVIPTLIRLTRAIGGIAGAARQSWINVETLADVIAILVTREDSRGAYNVSLKRTHAWRDIVNSLNLNGFELPTDEVSPADARYMLKSSPSLITALTRLQEPHTLSIERITAVAASRLYNAIMLSERSFAWYVRTDDRA